MELYLVIFTEPMLYIFLLFYYFINSESFLLVLFRYINKMKRNVKSVL